METTIKKNLPLKNLAKITGYDEDNLIKHILLHLKKLNVIADYEPADWGNTIRTHINYSDVYLIDLVNSLGFRYSVNSNTNLLDLVVIGTGDCPECGGEVELLDEDKLQVGGDGYNTPYEYVVLTQEFQCRNCHHKFTVKPDEK